MSILEATVSLRKKLKSSLILIFSFFVSLSSPENVSRLFDLIRVNDERVRPAFYFALRETLLAKDLNQARRIAYGGVDGKRHRVITLDGDLIEPIGILSEYSEYCY